MDAFVWARPSACKTSPSPPINPSSRPCRTSSPVIPRSNCGFHSNKTAAAINDRRQMIHDVKNHVPAAGTRSCCSIVSIFCTGKLKPHAAVPAISHSTALRCRAGSIVG